MCYNVYNKERREVNTMKNIKITITTKNPHGYARDLMIDEMLRKMEEDAEKAS